MSDKMKDMCECGHIRDWHVGHGYCVESRDSDVSNLCWCETFQLKKKETKR